MKEIDEDLGKVKSAQEVDEEENEDYEFDFSMYEDDEIDDESIDKKKVPMVSGLRSKYSTGEANLKRIGWLDQRVSMLAIEVAMYTKDYQKLKEFFATVMEKWQVVKYIFGKSIQDEINGLKKNCFEMLEEYKNKNIPHKLHNNLMALRDRIDMYCQFSNIGIETERANRGIYTKTKQDVIE